jgi:hypothetical protein
MNPFEMVIGIVLIVTIGSIVRSALFGRRRREAADEAEAPQRRAETQALIEEVRTLRDRVAVLERIVTDKGSLLEQEFERLRDER